MKKVKFNTIASFVAGQSPESKYYSTESGTPFLQGNRTFNHLYPTIDTYTNKITKIADTGDILISVRAPVGDLNIAKESLCIGRGLGAIKAHNGNNTFLYYVLKSNVNNLINQGNGTTYSSITKDIIDQWELLVPEKNEIEIGNILWAIDTTIENNNHINDNLHEMLKTEYGYIFLQNNNEDQKKVSISTLADLYQPKTISGDEIMRDGKYLVYGANGIIGKYNEFNHEDETIAIACRGASCGELQMTLPNCWITGNAMVVKPKSSFPYREFLYYTMVWNKPKRLVSGSAQPQITRDNLSLYEIKLPNERKLKEFENKAQTARKIITKNSIENQKLAELRDWLLPMLMNGQATIGD